MKSGDLVELSAYGCALVCLECHAWDVGIVTRHGPGWANVKWNRGNRPVHMNRRDIKKLKR